MRTSAALLAFMIAAVCCQAQVSREQVNDAIQRMQGFILSQQDPETGAFDRLYRHSPNPHFGGESSLATYALIRSGMSPQEPRIQKALAYLKGIRMNGTYAIALRAHCWAALHDEYLPMLARDTKWLLDAQAGGVFDYRIRSGPRFDHSVTQYGLLGLWESVKRTGRGYGSVWRNALNHFLEYQNPDGGWGYTGHGNSTPSMTAAGLTAVLIAQETLFQNQHKPPKQVSDAIARAVHWLDAYSERNGIRLEHGMRGIYYLVSLERAALANGLSRFGEHDWLQQGASQIIQREAGTGSLNGNLIDTALALMFLARVNDPIWIQKLKLSDQPWNNRPNDLNLFTRRLSDRVEQQLGWRVVDVLGDPDSWNVAPVVYLSSNEPVVLSAEAKHNLKNYLDNGGLWVANPEGGDEAFLESVREIASELYPYYTFERIGPDHPLLTLVHQVDVNESYRPWSLSNGVRDLIVLAPGDWGMALQADRRNSPWNSESIMSNLYAWVTDRGSWEYTASEYGGDMPVPTGTIRVWRLHEQDSPPLEPKAWEPMKSLILNRAGYRLILEVGSWEQAEDTGAIDLVYLGGRKGIALSPATLRNLVAYLHNGGTVLIETIGGHGDFAAVITRQLESVLGEQALPVDSRHPVITGTMRNIQSDPVGVDMRRVAYRRYSTVTRGPVDEPRLLTLTVKGREAVIISHEDLALGVMGCRRWGIDGYDTKSARGLMQNILLYAANTGG